VFTVRLPLLSRQPGEQSPSDPDLTPPTGDLASLHRGSRVTAPRVLVVDDNQDGADALVELARLLGYEARAAYDGLDLGLPGIDGYEVARRLREEPGLQATTLVAVTGYGRSEDRERVQEAGFDLHLTKPVHPDTVERLLSTLLPLRPEVSPN
jgi:CheY-like chemotaxis protein